LGSSAGADAPSQPKLLAVKPGQAAASGRAIDLNIVVIPATSSVSEPDPLFLLAGGPGQAATEVFPFMLSVFNDIRRSRDIVLVDQRGTGKSSPLICAGLDELEDHLDEEAGKAILRDCPAQLDADPRFYTTEIAMADLNDVRQALGYEQINLYGVSYGTRAALVYLHLYPETVRSVILDAVAGPELVLFLHMPRDGQRAMELLFSRCAADRDCHEAFPNLPATFAALLDSLAEPIELQLPHPLTTEITTFSLTRDLLTQFIFNAMYSSDFVALLPLLISHAHDTGDFGPLVSQALLVSEQTGVTPGLLYAVTCTEDAPFISLEEAAAIQAETYFPLTAETFLDICAGWPQGEPFPALRQPVTTDLPVLLLSGEADPVTPPHYAEQVAATLANGRHLVAPGYGHGVAILPCVNGIMTQFVREASVNDLDVTCLDKVKPPPFFVTFTGPKP
jgi:pimeloyl-ACP methyl ester carboxylesterase